MMRFKSIWWKLQYHFSPPPFRVFLADFRDYYLHATKERWAPPYMCRILKHRGCPGTLGQKLSLGMIISGVLEVERQAYDVSEPHSLKRIFESSQSALSLQFDSPFVFSGTAVERRIAFLNTLIDLSSDSQLER